MLEEILNELQQGNVGAAWTRLLDAWQEHRDPGLAEAVRKLGKKLVVEPLPKHRTLRAGIEGWTARAQAQNAADLPVLLPFVGVPKSLNHTTPMLKELERWAPDPRIADLALRRVKASPLSAFQEKGVGPSLSKLLRLHADHGHLAQLMAISGGDLKRRERVIKALAKSLPPPQELDCASLVAAIQKVKKTRLEARAASTGDELWDAVFEDPADHTARLVLADWLQQKGDPRGELIVLQLKESRNAAEDKRVERLLAKPRQLLGPLASVVTFNSAVFEGGFLSKAVIRPITKAEGNATVGHREWATVKSLEFTRYPILSPHMRSLTTVRSIDPRAMKVLCGPKLAHLPIEHLVYDNVPTYSDRPEPIEQLWQETNALQRLHTLELLDPPVPLPWLGDTRIGQQLKHLILPWDQGAAQDHVFWEILPLERLTLTCYDLTLERERTREGVILRLRQPAQSPHNFHLGNYPDIAPFLNHLPIREAVVVGDWRWEQWLRRKLDGVGLTDVEIRRINPVAS